MPESDRSRTIDRSIFLDNYVELVSCICYFSTSINATYNNLFKKNELNCSSCTVIAAHRSTSSLGFNFRKWPF